MAEINSTINSTATLSGIINNNAAVNGAVKVTKELESSIINNTPTISLNIGKSVALQGKMEPNINLLGDMNTAGIINISSFIYIKFADDDPTDTISHTIAGIPIEMYDTPRSTTQYLGICSTTSMVAPNRTADYYWVKIKGDTGAKGDTGEQGLQGEKGVVSVDMKNALMYEGTLINTHWTEAYDNNIKYYTQSLVLITPEGQGGDLSVSDITDIEIKESIENQKIKLSDKCVPLIDLKVSDNKTLGILQMKNWQYISRAYLQRIITIEDDIEIATDGIRLVFECYSYCPTIDLTFVLKVI